jgi:hypothetical protein
MLCRDCSLLCPHGVVSRGAQHAGHLREPLLDQILRRPFEVERAVGAARMGRNEGPQRFRARLHDTRERAELHDTRVWKHALNARETRFDRRFLRARPDLTIKEPDTSIYCIGGIIASIVLCDHDAKLVQRPVLVRFFLDRST